MTAAFLATVRFPGAPADGGRVSPVLRERLLDASFEDLEGTSTHWANWSKSLYRAHPDEKDRVSSFIDGVVSVVLERPGLPPEGLQTWLGLVPTLNVPVGNHLWWWNKMARTASVGELAVLLLPLECRVAVGDDPCLVRTRSQGAGPGREAFLESLDAAHPHGLDCLVAALVSNNAPLVERLVRQKVRFAPIDPRATYDGGQTRLEVRLLSLFNAIGGEGKRTREIARVTKVTLPDTPSAVAQRWKVLLDAGTPMLSDTGCSIKGNPDVALLEWSRGGMRSPMAMVDWLQMWEGLMPGGIRTKDWAASSGLTLTLTPEVASEFIARHDHHAHHAFSRLLALHDAGHRILSAPEKASAFPGSTLPPVSPLVAALGPFGTGDLSLFALLLQMGADPLKTPDGTVLLTALAKVCKSMARFRDALDLLEPHGVLDDPALLLPDEAGLGFLHHALFLLSDAHLSTVLEKGASLDLLDPTGCNLVMYHEMHHGMGRGPFVFTADACIDRWRWLMDKVPHQFAEDGWKVLDLLGQRSPSLVAQLGQAIERMKLDFVLAESSGPQAPSRLRL